ncbi:MAG TPA: transglycosylase SLT domain-containing protein, partial [Candidatus Nanoarchaeia archaeon]|nr:transglycosylase SLT domain-containing protein [Candidatus Nanoarchaeia archaeon]
MIRKASEKYNLPFNILDSLIFQESSYNTNAISSKGAEGLTQLMPGTARDLGITDTLNPEESIDAGARYLKRMFKMFGKSPKPIEEQWKFALAAYNAGPGNVIEAQRIAKSNGLNPNLWESIDDFMPKEETRDYVERISARSHLNS